jgi:hypothetical protein
MTWLAIALGVVVALAAALAVARLARARRSSNSDRPQSGTTLESIRAASSVLDRKALDLEAVMSEASAVLYIPIEAEQTYLAVARPDVRIEGRATSVPTQLAAAAVAGQAGLEALVKAGQLTSRLVLVDPKTAKAIRAGTMVKNKAGETLALVRGSGGRFSDVTRIKPLSGGLVKSAAAGPAMLSAIAMQAQLAQVEKAIAEVRDGVNAIRGYLEEAEEASVLGRRNTLAEVYQTAQETGQMTQALWDQIQDLEALLRRDVSMADHALARAVERLDGSATGLVGTRLKWLEEAGGPIAEAVAGVADARRSLVQFSVLRLWWLAVVDDPTLASRQAQLRELLQGLPDHSVEQARTDGVLAAVGDLRTHHRVLAPRKHREVAGGVQKVQVEMRGLPWRILNVAPELEVEA